MPKMFPSPTLILLILFLFFGHFATSQKVLILEKAGSTKTQRYYKGDVLTYLKKGDEQWHTFTILDLLPEDSIIVLDNQYLKYGDIIAIRSYKSRGWSRATALSLYTFGASWLLFTAGDELADPNNRADWELAAAVAGTSFPLGWAIQKIFKQRTYKVGKWRRLRMLDLRPVGEFSKP